MNIERLMTELGNIIADRHNLIVKTKVTSKKTFSNIGGGDYEQEVKCKTKEE